MAVQVIPKALSQGLGKLGGRSKQKMPIKMEVKEEPKLDATQDSTAITHKHKLQKIQPKYTPQTTPSATPVRPKRPKSAVLSSVTLTLRTKMVRLLLKRANLT